MFEDLTVLCPGIILETVASFIFLSPLVEIQIKDDPSYNCQMQLHKLGSQIKNISVAGSISLSG